MYQNKKGFEEADGNEQTHRRALKPLLGLIPGEMLNL